MTPLLYPGSSACPPEQTSPTTPHANRRKDQSPGACMSPPRYTAPPPSGPRFHCRERPNCCDRRRWHAKFARSDCCRSPDTLAPGSGSRRPSCSRHNPPPDPAPTSATRGLSAPPTISSTPSAADLPAAAARASVALPSADAAGQPPDRRKDAAGVGAPARWRTTGRSTPTPPEHAHPLLPGQRRTCVARAPSSRHA